MNKPKFTGKVRRGLGLMRSLVIDAMDDSKPPAHTIVARWPMKYQDDFNTAMEWIEANERNPDERSRPVVVSNGPGAQLAKTQRGSLQVLAIQAEGEEAVKVAIQGLSALHAGMASAGVGVNSRGEFVAVEPVGALFSMTESRKL